MMILTTVLATTITILIIIGIISLIFYKLYNKKCEVEIRLNSALKSLCSQLNIPLSYHDELGEAAGRILYHQKQGRLVLDKASIEILNAMKKTPYVLAHELGHYMAIKQRDDTSEQGADKEAYKLCCSILTDSEKILLATSLKCYFLFAEETL